jgi:hypothetical protein
MEQNMGAPTFSAATREIFGAPETVWDGYGYMD